MYGLIEDVIHDKDYPQFGIFDHRSRGTDSTKIILFSRRLRQSAINVSSAILLLSNDKLLSFPLIFLYDITRRGRCYGD
mgnify:CR=1 FL=1